MGLQELQGKMGKRGKSTRMCCMQAVAEVQRRYPEGVPLLSPEEDMSIADSAFRKAQRCGSETSPP